MINTTDFEEYIRCTQDPELCKKYEDQWIWIVCTLTDPSCVERKDIQSFFSKRTDILQELKYIGSVVQIANRYSVLDGIQLTNEDYYWLCTDIRGEKMALTCVAACYVLSEWRLLDDIKITDLTLGDVFRIIKIDGTTVTAQLTIKEEQYTFIDQTTQQIYTVDQIWAFRKL